MVFNVTDLASDDTIQFTADASSSVNDFCDWEETNHAMKANFVFSWEEESSSGESEFKKGITNPTGQPATYPSSQEEVSILSYYVRNSPPIFQYFDADGNVLEDNPARLVDTKMMKVFLIVNVDLNRAPNNFGLESYVQLRNLK